LTACLSDSNWPVKRSGYLLSNSLEVRFTVSIRTLPKPNSPNTEVDKVAFNINFANQGSVNSSGDILPVKRREMRCHIDDHTDERTTPTMTDTILTVNANSSDDNRILLEK